MSRSNGKILFILIIAAAAAIYLFNSSGKNITDLVPTQTEQPAKNISDVQFIELCKYGTLPEIQEAIADQKANVNAQNEDDETALMLAARNNSDPEVIKLLLQNGAIVDARDKNGFTPLIAASITNSNPQVIKALLQAGADINAQTKYGTTALMQAAGFNSNPAVIETLLDNNANADLHDNDGKNALDYARENKFLSASDVYWRLFRLGNF